MQVCETENSVSEVASWLAVQATKLNHSVTFSYAKTKVLNYSFKPKFGLKYLISIKSEVTLKFGFQLGLQLKSFAETQFKPKF